MAEERYTFRVIKERGQKYEYASQFFRAGLLSHPQDVADALNAADAQAHELAELRRVERAARLVMDGFTFNEPYPPMYCGSRDALRLLAESLQLAQPAAQPAGEVPGE